MRATLHDHAPNTYYGQWSGEKALFAGLQSPAIAHHELATSARVVAFDVAERDFPGNLSLPRWKFVYRPKGKVCAPSDVRASSDDHAAHRFHLKQQRSSARLSRPAQWEFLCARRRCCLGFAHEHDGYLSHP
jgi:hypothetical protein